MSMAKNSEEAVGGNVLRNDLCLLSLNHCYAHAVQF